MSALAVIPARAGSTRLKNKNVLNLAGKPLVAHTMETVRDADVFDHIVVSTDCPKVKEIASGYDLAIHDRPADHATVKATVLEALLNLMEGFKAYEKVAYFLPTCPFRNAKHVQEAFALLDHDCDTVVSTKPYSEPLQLAMVLRDDHAIPVFDNLTAGLTNSKYFQPYVLPNGGFYMGWWDHVMRERNFFRGRVRGYQMSKEESLDINDEFDMIFAEHMFARSIKG